MATVQCLVCRLHNSLLLVVNESEGPQARRSQTSDNTIFSPENTNEDSITLMINGAVPLEERLCWHSRQQHFPNQILDVGGSSPYHGG